MALLTTQDQVNESGHLIKAGYNKVYNVEYQKNIIKFNLYTYPNAESEEHIGKSSWAIPRFLPVPVDKDGNKVLLDEYGNIVDQEGNIITNEKGEFETILVEEPDGIKLELIEGQPNTYKKIPIIKTVERTIFKDLEGNIIEPTYPKVMGYKSIDSNPKFEPFLVENIQTNLLALCYNYLKTLPEFEGAQDV